MPTIILTDRVYHAVQAQARYGTFISTAQPIENGTMYRVPVDQEVYDEIQSRLPEPGDELAADLVVGRLLGVYPDVQ